LDFFCGLAYLIFIFEFIGITIYLYIIGEKIKAKIASWSFFWVNLFGYITYYAYAAAPPWYVAFYGMGPAQLNTPANPAGAARFDYLFGTHFFIGMYGKAADVFGAVPSLHVSYPLIALFLTLDRPKLRILSLSFYLLMCFSAVYLNHHYVLDVILGSLYATITYLIISSKLQVWNKLT
jgi:membrane-associated phospholipid phosphatase